MKKLLFISLYAVITCTAFSQGYAGYTRVAEQDSLALVAFYNATGGPNWYSSNDTFSIASLSDDVLVYHQTTYPYAGMGKWLVGPVKDWFGVLLEKQPGGNSKDSVWRVVHLRATISRRSAGNNNLKGYVPKEVGLLTALKWFKVNGNIGLSPTELPDEVYHPTLLELDIEGANMGGVISDAIRKCNRLEFINLRYNYWDSVPKFDFLSKDHLLNMWSTIFLYNTRISYATWEPSVDYFVSFTTEANKIKYQIQNQDQVGREREIVVKPGDTVTLVCNEAGKKGKCTWEKKGINTYKTGTTYTINNIVAKDTGIYRGLVENDYIKSWQAEGNGGVGQVKTKPIHVVFTPWTPVCKSAKTSYSGNEIDITFSKPMAMPDAGQTSEFMVSRNGQPVNVSGITRVGRLSDILRLTLDSSLFAGDSITISYTKGTVVDYNNGVLNSFSDMQVKNFVRPAPNIVSATSRPLGDGIILTFDQYIDGSTINMSDFKINTTDATQKITGFMLAPGKIDNEVSRQVILALANPLKETDNIQVAYKKGSLTALYGAAVQSFGFIPVTISIDTNPALVNITFKDGSRSLENIIVKGSLKLSPFNMEDKGINGDFRNWTKQVSAGNGTYTWSVYKRTSVTTYDTITTVDPNTGIKTIVIIPNTTVNDSLLSNNRNLVVTVANGQIAGDTVFSIWNEVVTFRLNLKNYIENNPSAVIEPYLMGLHNDWVAGRAMTKLSDTLYTLSASGYNIGDVIYFNFRSGSVWENSTPQKRTHTIAGNDTIEVSFGDITAIKTINQSTLSIYPNPVENFLYVSSPGTKTLNIRVFNIQGKCVFTAHSIDNYIDIKGLPKGIYLLEATSMNNVVARTKFIKK
jgi:uncharacterized repeat protein (TIGR02059 family)